MSSGGSIKHFFEQPAAEDSRVVAQLGRTFGLQGVVNEAKHNEQNPGRAITKAGINAALWYLGGEAGSALGSAGDAGSAAADAGSAVYDGMTAEQIAQNLGAVTAGENVGTMAGLAGGTPAVSEQVGLLGSMAPQGAANTMEAGLSDTGYTPSSLFNVFHNANAANGTSLGQNLSNYGSNLKTEATNGSLLHQVMGSKGAKQLAMKQSMSMLNPQRPQPMMQGAPAPQGPQGPLNAPYQSSPFGPGGNSLGLTEDQKKRLRMQGYNIQ